MKKSDQPAKRKIVKSIALSEDFWQQLEQQARKTCRSRNNYIEQVLAQHINQLPAK